MIVHRGLLCMLNRDTRRKSPSCFRGKGYEAFLPTYSHGTKYNKRFDLPLFPGYVFCRFEASSRLPVLTTPGVFSIAGNGLNPEPICEHEMEGLKRMLTANFTPVPWPYILPGQEVSLEFGPLRVSGVLSLTRATEDGLSFQSTCFAALSP
jgi:transcriptional antiterminator NusG